MNNNKAQSSIEFTIIVGAMTFIMLGAFLVIQGRTVSIHKEYMNNAMDKLGNMMRTEVLLASKMEGGYAREFTLPYAVSNYNYSIMISGRNEISISMGDSEYIIFTNANISGNITKGRNIIRSDGNNITINSLEERFLLCAGGEGSDNPGCGVIDCSGWYEASGNDCYNHEDITSARCEGFQDCKDANTADCDAQAIDAVVYSCGECKYIGPGACSGTTKGACSNNASGIPCSIGTCDGVGNCIGVGAFFIKSNAGVNLLSLDELGNIVLKGSCTVGTCSPLNPLDAFVLKNSAGTDVVAYIDSSGNLCIENGDCIGGDTCSTAGSASLVFKNAANTILAFIDNTGSLCLRGNLIQNGNP